MSIPKANPNTIHGKVLVGYQGWFTCAGDGQPIDPGHHGWLHWFNEPITQSKGRPNLDLWPDVQEYSPSELFIAPGLKMSNGDPAYLFSSRHPKTVRRHFNWMAKTGIDGAFLQRFLGQCDVLDGANQGIWRQRDEIGDRVREAAEQEGRVFAIMYDVSGVPSDRILRILQHDWPHLIRRKEVLDSPNYLRHNGRPVLCVWGLGMVNNGHTPELLHEVATFLRSYTPGGLYLIAGSPTHWRTFAGDADPNPAMMDVWLNSFDCISPWTVGRFRSIEDCDNFYSTVVKGDIEFLKATNERNATRKIDYMPVILPGGSGYNLSEGGWVFNDMPREGGRYLWRQLYNAYRLARGPDLPHVVHSIYGAMWDEYDEGTAYLPAVTKKSQLPVPEDPNHRGKWAFLSLDQEGYDIPSDWYMRILGLFGEALRNERRIHETFPSKELQDYWSTRPKLQGSSDPCSSGSSSTTTEEGKDANQQYQDWLQSQKQNSANEAPPPPYSLVEDEQPSAGTTSATSPAAAASNQQPTPESHPLTDNPSVSSISESLSQTVLSGPPLPPRHPTSSQATSQAEPSIPISDPNADGVGGFAPPPMHPSRPHRAQSYQGRPSASASTRPPAMPHRPTGLSHTASVANGSRWPPPHWKAPSPTNPPVAESAAVPTTAGAVHFPEVNIPSFPSTHPVHSPPTSPGFPSLSGEQVVGYTPPSGPSPQQSPGFPPVVVPSFPSQPTARPPSAPHHSRPEVPHPPTQYGPGRIPSPYHHGTSTPVNDVNGPSYLQSNSYSAPLGTSPSPPLSQANQLSGYPQPHHQYQNHPHSSSPAPFPPTPYDGNSGPSSHQSYSSTPSPGPHQNPSHGSLPHPGSSAMYPPAASHHAPYNNAPSPASSYYAAPQHTHQHHSGATGSSYAPQYKPPSGHAGPHGTGQQHYSPHYSSSSSSPASSNPSLSGSSGVPSSSTATTAGYHHPHHHPQNVGNTVSGPGGSTGVIGNALEFAVTNADKYMGKKIGSQVGNLAASGGKLFSKFSK